MAELPLTAVIGSLAAAGLAVAAVMLSRPLAPMAVTSGAAALLIVASLAHFLADLPEGGMGFIAAIAAGALIWRAALAGMRALSDNLTATVPLLALGLHSLADGAFYHWAFDHGSFAGLAAAAGLFAHEFAEAALCLHLFRRTALKPAAAPCTLVFTAGTASAGVLLAAYAQNASGFWIETFLVPLALGGALFAGLHVLTSAAAQIAGRGRGVQSAR
ncbi:MAG: hypothetical protein Tsb0010_11430 [Parvularculaceae bacterium]